MLTIEILHGTNQKVLMILKKVTSGDIPEWSEVIDPGSGHPYYYNNITGESSWEKPANFDSKKSHEMEQKLEQAAKARRIINIFIIWHY